MKGFALRRFKSDVFMRIRQFTCDYIARDAGRRYDVHSGRASKILEAVYGIEKEEAKSQAPARQVLDLMSSLERRIVGTEFEFSQRAAFGQDGEESLPGPTNSIWQVSVSTPLCDLPWSDR